MKTLTTCGAILVDESDDILIVRRSKTDKHRPLQWDLPGGHVEPTESLDTALVREVGEETSLDIASVIRQPVYAVSDVIENTSITWLFFIVHIQKGKLALSFEHDEYKWVSIDQAIDAIEYERKKKALMYVRDNSLLG